MINVKEGVNVCICGNGLFVELNINTSIFGVAKRLLRLIMCGMSKVESKSDWCYDGFYNGRNINHLFPTSLRDLFWYFFCMG